MPTDQQQTLFREQPGAHFSQRPGQIIFPSQVAPGFHGQQQQQQLQLQLQQQQQQQQQQLRQQQQQQQQQLHQQQLQYQLQQQQQSFQGFAPPQQQQYSWQNDGVRAGSEPAPRAPHPLRARLPLSIPDHLLDDEDDDDLNNIDMSNMTQEEKNEIRSQRKNRKMDREKIKRAKMNDQFEYLCKMLSMGRSTRVEKLAVLKEAIKNINYLKAENDLIRCQKEHMKAKIMHGRGEKYTPAPAPESAKVEKQVPQAAQFGSLQTQFGSQKAQFGSHSKADFGWQAPGFPQDNSDLSFAFGEDDSDHFWQAEPEPVGQQWFGQTKMVPEEASFNLKAFPTFATLDTDNNIDMFLESGDTSELLCF